MEEQQTNQLAVATAEDEVDASAAVQDSLPRVSIEEKIANGAKEKLRGNKLFAAGNFLEAKKAYDSAFVNIFTSKEEWEQLMTQEEKDEINHFKMPVHLNRGLCRMKTGELDLALWDTEEALRIDDTNTKGRYRRAVILVEKVKLEMRSEETGKFWDVEKCVSWMQESRADFISAAKAAPSDKGIRDGLAGWKSVRESLRSFEGSYRKQQQELFGGLIDKLDKSNLASDTKSTPSKDSVYAATKSDEELFNMIPKQQREAALKKLPAGEYVTVPPI